MTKQLLSYAVQRIGTNTKIGNLVGVSREAVRRWILTNRFPVNSLDRIANTLELEDVTQLRDKFDFETFEDKSSDPTENVIPLIVAIGQSGIKSLSPAQYKTLVAMQSEYARSTDGQIMPPEAIRALFGKPADPQQ